MFGNKTAEKPSAPESATSARASKASEITEGMNVTGDLDGDGDIRLDGKLEGNVRCRALTIGKAGELIGRVVAQEVTVFGTVRGDLRATQVKLESTAVVDGDVVHEVLEVAAGARIEGRYSRSTGKLEKKSAADVPKEPPPRAPVKLAKPGNGQQRPQQVVAGAAAGATTAEKAEG